MTPAKRLATIVLDSLEHPHRLFNGDVERLARLVLAKRPASPAKAWKPKTDTKPERRKAHRESTSRIRMAVFARARESIGISLCELCPDILRLRATDLAHLEGGIGRRRQRQSVKNTAASCYLCNREWDDHPQYRLAKATRWSQRTGLPIPHSVIAAHALKHQEARHA